MINKEILINNKIVKGYELQLNNAKFITIVAEKGYIMCGYLNMDTADKLNDCAVIIKGVNSIEEMLKKDVSSVSKTASKSGIKPGMTGFEAILLMI